MSEPVDGRRLLAWADLDERRRRGGRIALGAPIALAVGLGLGAEAARRGGWFAGARGAPELGYLVAVMLGALVPTMLDAPQRMFWRPDAAMVARLPIAGSAMWWVAVVRALRGAGRGVLIAAPAIAVAALADRALGARLAVVVAALAVVATLLIPAVCLGAAHLVASGQAAAATGALSGGQQVATTTWLGALPGATIAGVVSLVAASAGWMGGADPAAVWPIAVLAGASVIAGAAATQAAPRIYPRAMREVAALDRQILAHLEIHPVTGLERIVRDRLSGGAAVAFDRLARLARRRYPLFALGGAAGGLTLLGLAIGRPDATVALIVTAVVLLAIARSLYQASGRAPLELERSTATLPIAPADVTRARRALVGLWLAVWAAVPVAVAIVRAATY